MANLVAANRALLFKGALGAGLLAEMALCPRLWTSARAFPTVPALDGLPDLPAPASVLLTALFAASVLAALLRPRFGLAVVALGAALALFDLDRLQPWFYQALLLFGAASLPDEEAWPACAFVLAATYVWSGLQKANLAFGERVFPWLLHPLGLDALRPLWFFAPLGETSIGLLLLLPRTRLWGLALAVGMHAFLLAALGPAGRGFNSVVWPWNVAMPALAFIAFFRNPAPVLPAAVRTWGGRAVVALAGALPALNSLGLWDDNLSDALYSGRSRQAFLLLSETGAARLPPGARPYVQRRPDRIGVDVDRWALAELNVPPYPEVRAFQTLARRLGVPSPDLKLVVTGRPALNEAHAAPQVVPLP